METPYVRDPTTGVVYSNKRPRPLLTESPPPAGDESRPTTRWPRPGEVLPTSPRQVKIQQHGTGQPDRKTLPFVQDPTTGVVYLDTKRSTSPELPSRNTNNRSNTGSPNNTGRKHQSPWTTARGRSPSPRRSVMPSQHPGRPPQNSYGYQSRYGRTAHGSAYHTGTTYHGAQWPRRRCYTLLWGLLLFLLLAALAAGIYFLVKYIEQQRALRAPDVVNPGGSYYNGLYIITSTIAPGESWGIVGHDRPCNPYNNNSQPSVVYPDCDTLTTTVTPINYTTTTTTASISTIPSGSQSLIRGYCITLSWSVLLHGLSA